MNNARMHYFRLFVPGILIAAAALSACSAGGSVGRADASSGGGGAKKKQINTGLDAFTDSKGAPLDPAETLAPESNDRVALLAKEQMADRQSLADPRAALAARGPTPKRAPPAANAAATASPNNFDGASFSLSDADSTSPQTAQQSSINPTTAPTSPAPTSQTQRAQVSGASAQPRDPSSAAESAWASASSVRSNEFPQRNKPAAPSAFTNSTPDDQLIELASKMARLLREPSPPDRPRISDGAALAPIESVRPGAISQLESSKSVLGRRLNAEDRKTLIDARERLAASPGEATEAFAKAMAQIAPGQPLKITRAILCSKVMGFGKYNAFTATTFIAGRPIPAVVYVELDNFSARPAREGDQLLRDLPLSEQASVELTQSLSLFQDPSALLAWHRPPQPITDTSRAHRRDFYLIQVIELPRSLSIGRYNLKVTVKDKTTGAEAESIIPITVVAQ